MPLCAWTPRDRVIVKRMITYLARETHNVCVEVEGAGDVRVKFDRVPRVLAAS